MSSPPSSKSILGWREWVQLPDLGIPHIKAKIDTGARSSALHAFDVTTFSSPQEQGQLMVSFKVHPHQRNTSFTIRAIAPLLAQRQVRNSGGQAEVRPVILTTVDLDGQRWPLELTLTNRDVMGFRMLLGRQAIRRRFLVDAGRSFLHGRRHG